MASRTAIAIALMLTANTRPAAGAINRFANDAERKLNSIKKAATWDNWGNNNLKAGALMAAPITYTIAKAAELESKITDVAKVANIDFGSKQFVALGESAMKIGENLGITSDGVAELMAELAAGGVAANRLESIATMAGKVGVAFDVSAGEAGRSFMIIQNAMALTEDKTKLVMDAMNAATNKFGGKPRELMNFMAQGGASVATALKISGVAMQAFGNSFQAVGISSAEAATTMERFQKAILKNTDLAKLFNKAGGGAKGMVAILEAARKSGNATKWLMDRDLGEYSGKVAQMANNMDTDRGLKAQLSYLSNEKNVAGSSDREYDNQAQKTTHQFNQLKVSAMNIAVKLGDTLIPVLRSVMTELKPVLKNIFDWVKANPELTGRIMKFAAMLAVGRLALGGVQKGVGGIISFAKPIVSFFKKGETGVSKFRMALNVGKKGIEIFRGGISKFTAFLPKLDGLLGKGLLKIGNGAKWLTKVMGSGFTKTITGVAKGFSFLSKTIGTAGRFLLANPIILIITAIAVAAFLIIKNWDKIKPWLQRLWGWVVNITKKTWNAIKSFFVNTWDNIKALFSKSFEVLKELFLNFTPAGLVIKYWEPLTNFFSNLWSGITSAFRKAIDWIVGKFEWLNNNVLKPIGLGFGDSTVTVKNAATPTVSPKPVAKGNSNSVAYSPTINLYGSATEQDRQAMAAQSQRDFKKLMDQYEYNQKRKNIG